MLSPPSSAASHLSVTSQAQVERSAALSECMWSIFKQHSVIDLSFLPNVFKVAVSRLPSQ